MFEGVFTALVTPFRNGELDEPALRELVEWQVQSGVDGLVPCGSTGESATLSHAEHCRVIAITVEQVRRRIPVVAGSGSNSTAEAIKLTSFAREAGADGALLISPYYNKPTQEGIYRHYRAIAESVDLPLVVYNIPGRTGSNILPETMARLASVRNIVGVKEAAGSLDQASEIRRLCGENFVLLSGDDSLTLPFIAIGGRGVVSVLSNLLPKETCELTRSALNGDLARARQLHFRYLPLVRALFVETNPIPVKYGMSLMGRCTSEVRLPLTPLSEGAAATLREAMAQVGLLR